MAVIEEVHIGDIGTAFRLTVRDGNDIVDVSTATDMLICFSKPDVDGTVLSQTASLYTDGTDGIIQYVTTTVSDLDVSGPWRLQAKLTLPASGTWRSSIEDFQVYENLCPIV